MTQPLSPPPLLLPGVRPERIIPPVAAPRPEIAAALASKRLKKLLSLKAQREREALRIYEPVPAGEQFHKSMARTKIALGGNRSGKTQSCAFEAVSIANGCHPYRKTPEGGANIYILASDQKNIGETMWPKMAHPGSFRIIRDEHTRLWRPVRPENEYDAAYEEKWRDAPPLIDIRMLANGKKGIAWEAANREIPSRVKFKNGSTMSFYTANSVPRRGFEIDGAWIDEEQDNEEWIFELYRGLMKSRGWLLYSATPQHGTHWLHKNWGEATSPHNDGSRIAGFLFLPDDNPFLSQKSKEEFKANMAGNERELKVRWEGGFALSERIVYPEFSRESHVIPPEWPGSYWNRYLIIDPGIKTAAVLFAAVAPDVGEDGLPHPKAGEVHIYDELYLGRCGAEAVAARVAERVDADPNAARSNSFVAFIMDGRAGRQTQMGSGRTIQSDYRDAFRSLGLISRVTGSDFIHGSDNIDGREESLHFLLQQFPDGDSLRYRLRIHSRCNSLIWEFPQQTWKKDKSGLILRQREKRPCHAIDCLEYFADYNPEWIYFSPPKKEGGGVYEDFKARKQRRRRREGSAVLLGPPE